MQVFLIQRFGSAASALVIATDADEAMRLCGTPPEASVHIRAIPLTGAHVVPYGRWINFSPSADTANAAELGGIA